LLLTFETITFPSNAENTFFMFTSFSFFVIAATAGPFPETDAPSAPFSIKLVKLGIKVQEKEDGLILESSENLSGAELNSENDHRLFMAFCIAGMYIGDCTVTDPESAKISYPNFIEEMVRLGAKIQTL